MRGCRGKSRRSLKMPYLVESDVRATGQRTAAAMRKTASDTIREFASGRNHFDVFLSHSIADETLVLGIVEYLRQANLTVYVDWIVDPKLDRTKVNAASADVLRKRMRQCDMLFYLWSKNAGESRWMPWELGYFDAYRGKIAVLPVVSRPGDIYVGTEFVGLYPVVDVTGIGSQRILKVDGQEPKSWSGGLRTIRNVLRG